MKPLEKVLGFLNNPEAQSLSEESQLKLVESIEDLLLFNYDNWYANKGIEMGKTSFKERLDKFKEWNEELNTK